MDRVIRGFGDLHFFCLNDTLDNAPADDIRMRRLKETLQGLFGFASRYERARPDANAGANLSYKEKYFSH
jgi:hypothetical protein